MLEVFITDLAAYNDGYLIGQWFTLPSTDLALSEAIAKVLNDGESVCGDGCHEEYFITDWEWSDHTFFEIGEYSSLHEINDQLNQLDGKSDYELKAIAFLLSEGIVSDMDEAIDKADDVIIHANQTMEDVAYDLIQECYNIHDLSPLIANHIDYEGIGRDIQMDGCYYEYGHDIIEYTG